MQITINGEAIQLESRDQLMSILGHSFLSEYNEIWIRGHGTSALCAMTNTTHAFYMFLRSDGDSGFRSQNPSADQYKYYEFKLSNGQADEYPETWLVTKDTFVDVLLAYYISGEMHHLIDWIEH